MDADEMICRAELCRVYSRNATTPEAAKTWTKAAEEWDLLAQVVTSEIERELRTQRTPAAR